jgi:hypothetical protein
MGDKGSLLVIENRRHIVQSPFIAGLPDENEDRLVRIFIPTPSSESGFMNNPSELFNALLYAG